MWSSRASALLATAALVAATPGVAAARTTTPPKRKLCADRVAVRDAPEGFAIGYLHRPQKLAVYGRPVDHWVLIRARGELTGWIPEKALCRRGR